MLSACVTLLGCSDYKESSTASYERTSEVLRLYSDRCLICHGISGKGDGKAALALKEPIAPFENITASQAESIIVAGTGQMPGWSEHLTQMQIDELVRYVIYLSD